MSDSVEIERLSGKIELLVERTENLCERVDEIGKQVRGSLARQSQHREATLEQLLELERRCDERDEKLEARIRLLEGRRPGPPPRVSPKVKQALLALALAVASALAGGGAGKLTGGAEARQVVQEEEKK